ncbi:MAG: hypothetical protein ABIC68_05970 [Candidatus Omnitrophota bacterium]
MINSRVKIDYFDQNESFAQFLPRTGTVIKRLTDEYKNDNWFLIKLDEPFDYQWKTGENFQFKLINIDKFLIRSRIKNEEINSQDGTSVFMMFIPDESKLSDMPIKINDYVQVAWGYVKILDKEE